MHGEPTDAALVEEFRAEYLYSGNAAKSGRKVGIKERTARDLAKRLQEDPSFAEDRRKLRAQHLDDLVALRMRVATKAAERFLGPAPMPEVGAGGVAIDKRPDYARVVIDAERNAQNLARFEAERNGLMRPAGDVVIRITGPAGAKSGDDADDSGGGRSPV